MSNEIPSNTSCIEASLKHLPEYRDFLNDYLRDEQRYYTNLRDCFENQPIRRSIQRLVEYQIRWAKGESLPNGWVPMKTFWIVWSGHIVGEAVVRLGTAPMIESFAGNITYYIRPAYRQKGFGHELFGHAISFARQKMSEFLVTCSSENLSSQKIIVKSGGSFLDERDNTESWGEITRRYRFHGK